MRYTAHMGKRFTLDLPPEVRQFYREASARRQRVTRACAQCGAELVDVTTRRLYCSNRCAVRTHRQRQRDQIAPPDDAAGRA
jgi:hypothetical protein